MVVSYDQAYNDEKMKFPEVSDFTLQIGERPIQQIIADLDFETGLAQKRINVVQSLEDIGGIPNATYLGKRDWNLRLIDTYQKQARILNQELLFGQIPVEQETTEIAEEQTFQILVYELDESKSSGFKSQYYPEATIEFQQSLISQGKLFYEGGHQVPSLEFIKNHYGFTEPMKETKQIIVVELDNNGKRKSEYYPTATEDFIQALISQDKLFYEGSQVSLPSLEFVKQHYGYTEPIIEETFDIVEYTLLEGSVVQKLKYNVLQSYLNDLNSNNIMWKTQGTGYTNQEVYDFYNYTLPIITPSDDSSFTFPMVSQTGIEFCLSNNRVKGRVTLDKIISNWNPYYNDINLISYFELRNKNGLPISSLGQIKQNIVKFPPSQLSELPTQELTFDESAENYKQLQVKILLTTSNDLPVSEPLIFQLTEGIGCIDVLPVKLKRDDFMSKAVGIFGGLLGVSLLISGNKKV